MDDLSGQVVDKYRLTRQIGAGGMGDDYYSTCDCEPGLVCNTDPLNDCSDTSGNRVIRGGGFNAAATGLRVSDRYVNDPSLRSISIRCARTP